MNEVKKIKALLTDPEFDHWPIVSIAGHALREGKLTASLFTWYKYARFYGITKKGIRKVRKTVGIVSTCPNEYLHIDTTEYPLVDGSVAHIAFISDNFSKMILGMSVGEKRNFLLVKTALQQAFPKVLSHPDMDRKESLLVADGGSENHNRFINDLIFKVPKEKIKKITARKDIKFSNAPAEVINRIIKNRYLKNKKFESVKSLEKFLEWAITDYNEKRPHNKFKTRTPYEVYYNIGLTFDLKERMEEGRRKRIVENKSGRCIQCKGRGFKEKLNGYLSILKKNCDDCPGEKSTFKLS